MVTTETFRELALSFPGTIEQPHFDRAAFKVINKRIFATLHEGTRTANLKLSLNDQTAYCSYDSKAVFPVPNKWGQQGWTTFELEGVSRDLVWDALNTAYNEVIKAKKGKG